MKDEINIVSKWIDTHFKEHFIPAEVLTALKTLKANIESSMDDETIARNALYKFYAGEPLSDKDLTVTVRVLNTIPQLGERFILFYAELHNVRRQFESFIEARKRHG